MTMPDPLESLSDGELSEVFAVEVAKLSSAFFLIKRGLYYRPNAAGYTNLATEAGRFDSDYAKRETKSTNGEVKWQAASNPPFATSADAVMPWLEKLERADLSRTEAKEWEYDFYITGAKHCVIGEGKTLARAICIGLIRIHRFAHTIQQDCEVRE